jgi:hypothetical protein
MQTVLKPRLCLPCQPAIPNKRRRIETKQESKVEPLNENPISLFSPRNNPNIKLSLSRSVSYEKFIGTLDDIFINDCYVEDEYSFLKSTPSPSPVRSQFNESITKYIEATNPKYEDSPRPSSIIKDFFNFGAHCLNLG